MDKASDSGSEDCRFDSDPLRKCLGARAELFVQLRIGQRHPQALVRAVIGVSHLSRGVVVLEEGHEYRRRVAVGFA